MPPSPPRARAAPSHAPHSGDTSVADSWTAHYDARGRRDSAREGRGWSCCVNGAPRSPSQKAPSPTLSFASLTCSRNTIVVGRPARTASDAPPGGDWRSTTPGAAGGCWKAYGPWPRLSAPTLVPRSVAHFPVDSLVVGAVSPRERELSFHSGSQGRAGGGSGKSLKVVRAQPHWMRQFMVSLDPDFLPMLRDIQGFHARFAAACASTTNHRSGRPTTPSQGWR